MKRKQAKQAIKVLQAWLDGTEIEERHKFSSRWCAFTDTMYLEIGKDYKYRIKPQEPPFTQREWWLNFRTGTFSAVVPAPYAGHGTKVREIIE